MGLNGDIFEKQLQQIAIEIAKSTKWMCMEIEAKYDSSNS